MDFADEAQTRSENLLAQQLANRQTLTIPFSGVCLSCEEPLTEKRRFCDSECREDYERERKRKMGIRAP